jgi:glycosyltransferase involved in cell wall biosynthesis
VLLHDVRLTGLYQRLAESQTISAEELSGRLRLVEGQTPDSIDDPGVYMVGEVIDRARRVYVHTEKGRDMILEKRPRRAADVFVVPFAMPPAQRKPSRVQGPLIVAAFGYVQHGRLLLDSAAEILAQRPEVRVCIIGDGVVPGELAELRAIADARELAVEFAGWTDDDEYQRSLDEAAIAIQLRDYPHGEMSASVADCLATGVATASAAVGAGSRERGDLAD